MPLPFLLFGLLPILEIALFALCVLCFGWSVTLLLTLATSFWGFTLTRRRWFTRPSDYGESQKNPPKRFEERLLGYLSGILLMVPGFLTDLAGILLFFPFGRRLLLRFWQKIVRPGTGFASVFSTFNPFSFFGGSFRREESGGGNAAEYPGDHHHSAPEDDVIDVEYEVKR